MIATGYSEVFVAASEDEVDNFIIFAAYGSVMLQFQTFEMLLWRFLSRSIKDGSTLDQAMAKVARWDKTTIGQIVRGLKNQPHWAPEEVEELEGAVATRNYLAHHFLREYFMIAPSNATREQASQHLANISVRLETLAEQLEATLRQLGASGGDELNQADRDAIDALRPTDWLTGDSPLRSQKATRSQLP